MWGEKRFHVSSTIYVSTTSIGPLLRKRCPNIYSQKWISQLHLDPPPRTHHHQMWGHEKIYDEIQMCEVLEYSSPFSLLDSPL